MASGSEKNLRFRAQIYIQSYRIHLLDVIQHFHALFCPGNQCEIVNKLENQWNFF